MDQIEILEERSHSKASELYKNVKVKYGNEIYDWDIPIIYRHTGVDFSEKSEEEVVSYIHQVLEWCDPKNWDQFKKEQDDYWSTSTAAVTKRIFDILSSDFTWKSTESDFPPNNNRARRIGDLKTQGYTIVTRTNMWDEKSEKKCTHYLLLPIPRGIKTGYESWSPSLKNRIIKLLNGFDVYENRKIRGNHVVIDHKFPEIRWDTETQRENLDDLSDEEIIHDFQLMDNQRNEQKREVCRNCLRDGVRGFPFGIEYYAKGEKIWDPSIPKQGKLAEAGCEGCGWYDFAEWRKSLQEKIEKSEEL